MRKLASIGAVMLGLAGCYTTEEYEQLQRIQPVGDAFQQALAVHYLEFARQEYDHYDWRSVELFAQKGLAAARGEPVPPESPQTWSLDEHARSTLDAAYQTLQTKLTAHYKKRRPKQAAELQFSYECWLEEQEEGWEIAAINACKQRFTRLLEETDPPIPMGGPLATSYVLHFPWDGRQPTAQEQQKLQGIAARLKQQKQDYQIVINGHADASGADEYNLQLSHDRAQFIYRFLRQAGVPAERIEYFAFGESDPKVVAPDNTRHKANRRVELFIE